MNFEAGLSKKNLIPVGEGWYVDIKNMFEFHISDKGI